MKWAMFKGKDVELVAPARGRGLKSLEDDRVYLWSSRPRKGAWIEISRLAFSSVRVASPPQGGVD